MEIARYKVGAENRLLSTTDVSPRNDSVRALGSNSGRNVTISSTRRLGAAAAQRKQCPKFVALARRLTPPDVKVTFHNGDFGYAVQSSHFVDQKKREIYVPYLRTASDLQVYLHELGHILNRPPSDSEAEYQAEIYSFKTMQRAGIRLPRWTMKQNIPYIGWHIVNDLLHDRDVSAEALAFTGLKGVHRLTIIRAHAIALKRIGYVPKYAWYGKGKHKTMMAPADAKYWSALLAAVPAATSSTAAEIEEYEAEQQAMCEREWSYVEDEEGNYYG